MMIGHSEIIVIVIVIAIIVSIPLLEWKIGKAIGKRVTKSAGLVFGIILIVLFPFFLAGIACILHSQKNADVIIVNTNGNVNPSNPAAISNSDTRRCPYCAETIQKQAIICRFCGKDVGPAA
jgi:ABC-type Na+ efflux pump permease subunit